MKKIILIAALAVNTVAFSQIDRSIRPKAAKAPVINIKDSEVFKLDNGITVILSENNKIPKVSIQFISGIDPYFEKNQAGAADLTGQLLMSGTKSRTKDQLDQQIDYLGASINASSTTLTLSTLTKHIDKAMELFSDVLMNASFPEDEFSRIIKMNESALMSVKSSPEQIADNVTKKFVYQNHPYGEVMNEMTLKNITLQNIKDTYSTTFNPTNGYLVIVGNMNKEQAKKYAEKYLGYWKGQKSFTNSYESNPLPKGTNVIFVNKPGSVQSYITVAFPLNIKTGSADQIGLNVANGVLGGGGFGTRLFQNLREDKGYTYGAYSSLNITRHGSYFEAAGSFRNAVTDSAIVELIKEIKNIGNSYVTDEELLTTKASMAGQFALGLERPATIANFAYNIIRNNLPRDYYQTYLQKLEAVDKDVVLEMSQKYFSANNCYIIVVGSEDILPKLKQFDSDGNIDIVDAFGDFVKERKATTVKPNEVYSKYTQAITMTSSDKAALKKNGKLKSIKIESDLSSPQIPIPLKQISYYVAPNKEAMTLEAQGMVLQKSFFDGKKGGSSNMQTGLTESTQEEIDEKLLTAGFITEIKLMNGSVKSEMLGIEEYKGNEVYVIKYVTKSSEVYNYYDVKSNLKVRTVSINEQEGEKVESEVIYDNYKDVSGYKIPYTVNFSAGGATFNGSVKNVEINKTIDHSIFSK